MGMVRNTFNFILSEKLARRFESRANELGITRSELIRILMLRELFHTDGDFHAGKRL